jgi:hypothetical protein
LKVIVDPAQEHVVGGELFKKGRNIHIAVDKRLEVAEQVCLVAVVSGSEGKQDDLLAHEVMAGTQGQEHGVVHRQLRVVADSALTPQGELGLLLIHVVDHLDERLARGVRRDGSGWGLGRLHTGYACSRAQALRSRRACS